MENNNEGVPVQTEQAMKQEPEKPVQTTQGQANYYEDEGSIFSPTGTCNKCETIFYWLIYVLSTLCFVVCGIINIVYVNVSFTY